ncbi:MAG: radical SAM family heme chaperone HemW [Caldicoprobacterales bacterium]|jgi:oxygen-independent coproporphyrinogen-3 oxidase|nr:oxygen-independent coproporphyrinogen III oxidase [Clostridiales bacterium]
MSKKDLGLYVHFPFCPRKCLYCDFPSFAGREFLMDNYLDAVRMEISQIKKRIMDRNIKTIFWGGGTPTFFHGEKLKDLLCYIKANFLVLEDAEITTEANPETLDKEKLEKLKEAGFNRLSIGMQAGQDRILKSLGRVHSIRDVEKSIKWARELGFNNINLDLMFGLPDQTLNQWVETLAMAEGMGVEHISAYALIIEEGTPFYELDRQGRLNKPSEELEREMYHKAIDYLKSKGYIHYEISNFAQPGKECRHNLIYWKNEDYIGIGCGAHSSLDGQRWSNYSDISQYIDSIENTRSAVDQIQRICVPEQRFETIMMGLRLTKGVSKSEFRKRFHNDISYYYNKAIDGLKSQGLLEEDSDNIYLTSKGMDLQNQVLLYFMD